ncbi:hypothetical protein PTTG_30526, partial [Puccinia triticina 1-1 BBBD Race 1]
MQISIDNALKIWEPENEDHESTTSNTNQRERELEAWKWHIVCQGKMTSGAHDMGIPKWAVPNVKAIWDAKRNRLGK